MNWVDGVLLGALLLSALVGAWRGLVFEAISLISWLLALLAARLFGEWMAMQLPWPDLAPSVRYGIGFLLVLLVVRLLLKLLALGLRALIHSSVLSGVDRLLGAVFGLLRGGLLLGLLAFGVMLTPMREQVAWNESPTAAWLMQGVTAVRPVIWPKIQTLWLKAKEAV